MFLRWVSGEGGGCRVMAQVSRKTCFKIMVLLFETKQKTLKTFTLKVL